MRLLLATLSLLLCSSCLATSGELHEIATRVELVATQMEQTSQSLAKVEGSVATFKEVLKDPTLTPEQKVGAAANAVGDISALIGEIRKISESWRETADRTKTIADDASKRGDDLLGRVGSNPLEAALAIAGIVATAYGAHKTSQTLTVKKVNQMRDETRAKVLEEIKRNRA